MVLLERTSRTRHINIINNTAEHETMRSYLYASTSHTNSNCFEWGHSSGDSSSHIVRSYSTISECEKLAHDAMRMKLALHNWHFCLWNQSWHFVRIASFSLLHNNTRFLIRQRKFNKYVKQKWNESASFGSSIKQVLSISGTGTHFLSQTVLRTFWQPKPMNVT